MSNNIYDILGKIGSVLGVTKPTENATTEPVYESVESRGSITEAVKSLEEKYMGFKKTVAAVKKGGSAEDPEAVAAAIGRKKYGKAEFQKAAAAGKKLGEGMSDEAKLDRYHELIKQGMDPDDAEMIAFNDEGDDEVDEGKYDEPAAPDADAIAKRKRLQAIKDRQEDEQGYRDERNTPIRKVAGKAYGGAAQKDSPEVDDLDEGNIAKSQIDLKKHSAKAKSVAASKKAGKDYDSFQAHLAKTDPNHPMLDKKVAEVAPPGAKAERMVKHIKKGYAKDGALTKREKGIAYATAWKAHNKGQVEEGVEFKDAGKIKNSAPNMKKAKPAMVKESRVMEETDYFYEKVGKALAEKNPTLNTADSSFVTAVRQEMVAQGIEPNRARNIIMTDEDFIGDVATSYSHYCQEIAECNAPENSFVGGIDQELDEIARLAGIPVEETEVYNEINVEESPDTMDLEEEEMGEGNEFSGALAQARASGAKEFEVDGKKYTVKEAQEKLDEMINANISFTADDLDAVTLMQLLAGIQHRQEETVQPTDNTVPQEQPQAELEEERDIEHLNTPREKVAGVDAVVPSGTDLNRSKKQDPATANKAANPLAVKEETLWKAYEDMLGEVKK